MSPAGHSTQLQALIDLAAAGHSEAYGELISQASTRLLRLTRKMLRGFPRLRRWEETDDVFQTAALRLHRSLSQVQPTSVREFFGLATLQIRRTLIDLARHHYGPERHGAKHQTDGEGQGVDDAAWQQHAVTGASPGSLDDWIHFHEAVAQLPEDEREAFQLVWYGGMSQQEAASLVGVSLATIQRRWYRAQNNLGVLLREG